MKCGSSSVNRALKELPKASQEYFPDANNRMKAVYQGKQNNLIGGPSQTLIQQQQEANLSTKNGTFQYFTTVRDRVKRFVSAVAQEMHVHRESDRNAQDFRTKCLKETPQETLACAIGHVLLVTSKNAFQASFSWINHILSPLLQYCTSTDDPMDTMPVCCY